MKAPRILMLTTVVLMTFHALALAQQPVPTPVAPVATPAPVAMVQPVAPLARPAVAPMVPRASARPELAMEPLTPLAASVEQTPQPPVPPPPPVPPQTPKVVMPKVAPVPEGATPTPKVVREPSAPRKMIAVKVEFTITDQLGTKPPTKKTMTMTVATGEVSRIRTNVRYARKSGNSWNTEIAPLSVDARPEVEGNKIWLDFTLEYSLLDEPAAESFPGGSTTVSERLFAVLDNGVPTVIAQSSDALSDRKITIEVKATIVK